VSRRSQYEKFPARVYWEVTRACALACRHCRAEAAPEADPAELDTKAAKRLLADLAAADPKPHVVLTGGDPLERADLFELIDAARALGLVVNVSPSATPRLTADAIDRLHDAGVAAISLSIDRASAEAHDAIRGVPGCFERTIAAAKRAREVGLPFQVNTLIARETLSDMEEMDALVRRIGASRWSLFFLVAVGRGTVLEPISAEETEKLLVWLASRAKEPGPVVTTTEAPHFRRVVLEQRGGAAEQPAHGPPGHSAGIRDGNGVMFISRDGAISPSGFLPLSAGNVKLENPLRVYAESMLFRSLRDVDGFHGRCGVCEYRAVCGGSRARAFAATGDPLAEDPLCPHEPATRESRS
jgi:radical SAM protein